MSVQSSDLRLKGLRLAVVALGVGCLTVFCASGLMADDDARREGEQSSESRISRDGDRLKEGPRDGEGIQRGPRDGDARNAGPREGDRPRYGDRPREGDRGRAGDSPRETDRRTDSPVKSEGPFGNRMGVSKFFGLMDKDRNGRLSQNEIDMAVAVLRSLDRDRDGEVSLQEFGQPGSESTRDSDDSNRGFSAGMDLAAMMRLADKNSDGLIGRDEAPERLRPFFDRIDSDGDGSLSASEIANARSRASDLRGNNSLRDRLRDGAGDSLKPRDEAGGRTPKRPEF
ncbi:MAG: hypothetical protein WBD20_25620 [Pirellulaceae bacterium]